MAYTFQSLRENLSMVDIKLGVTSCLRFNHKFYSFIFSMYFTFAFSLFTSVFFPFCLQNNKNATFLRQLSLNLLTGIFRVSGSSDLHRPVRTVSFLFRQVTAVAKECQLAFLLKVGFLFQNGAGEWD